MVFESLATAVFGKTRLMASAMRAAEVKSASRSMRFMDPLLTIWVGISRSTIAPFGMVATVGWFF